MNWLLLLTGLFLTGNVYSQSYRHHGEAPPHDECYNARFLPENTWLSEDNYTASLSAENTRPPKYPGTCIQTYENDLWYTFETNEAAEYQITIVHQVCNTPAGLQSLLIQASECNPELYRIVTCSNKKIADTIKMFFISSASPQTYLLYIDGYDGTMCSFDLQLKKEPGALNNPKNLRYNRFYTDSAACKEHFMGLSVNFENNKPVLDWKDSDAQEAQFYVIERILKDSSFERLGTLNTEKSAAGFQENYRWTDYISFLRNDDTYAYRIVRINSAGEKECSESVFGKVRITKSFFVAEPVYTQNKGIYQVNYIIHKKQDYSIAILDQNFNVVKERQLTKVGLGENYSLIDLNPYEPGTYYFRMSSGQDQFIRKIEND